MKSLNTTNNVKYDHLEIAEAIQKRKNPNLYKLIRETQRFLETLKCDCQVWVNNSSVDTYLVYYTRSDYPQQRIGVAIVVSNDTNKVVKGLPIGSNSEQARLAFRHLQIPLKIWLLGCCLETLLWYWGLNAYVRPARSWKASKCGQKLKVSFISRLKISSKYYQSEKIGIRTMLYTKEQIPTVGYSRRSLAIFIQLFATRFISSYHRSGGRPLLRKVSCLSCHSLIL